MEETTSIKTCIGYQQGRRIYFLGSSFDDKIGGSCEAPLRQRVLSGNLSFVSQWRQKWNFRLTLLACTNQSVTIIRRPVTVNASGHRNCSWLSSSTYNQGNGIQR